MTSLRILITGFRPFPGAPYNPTEKLVARLTALKRPALGDVERIGHIFTVTYGAVDRELPELITTHRPDALLMFGLASRTPYVRIETRARNTVTQLWPDADHTPVHHRAIENNSQSTQRFGAHTTLLLRAARATCIDARASLSAGYYLCNYLSWRAIETSASPNGPKLTAFVHVPAMPRGTVSIRRDRARRITSDQLEDAGEAILMEMVKLTRRKLTQI